MIFQCPILQKGDGCYWQTILTKGSAKLNANLDHLINRHGDDFKLRLFHILMSKTSFGYSKKIPPPFILPGSEPDSDSSCLIKANNELPDRQVLPDHSCLI